MKSGNLTKIGKCLAAALAAVLVCATGAACKNETEAESELRGTFSYTEIINQDLFITHRLQESVPDSGRTYLFSNVAPIDSGSEGTRIAYSIDQRLKLNRDFTYLYDYTVLLSNPGDWGGQISKLTVSITGTFEFLAGPETGTYSVLLSDPTGGTEQVNGSFLGAGGIYGWSMHSRPDMTLDFYTLSKAEDYEFDEYVKSRVVVVNRSTHVLTDDVFYPQLLNYTARFSSY